VISAGGGAGEYSLLEEKASFRVILGKNLQGCNQYCCFFKVDLVFWHAAWQAILPGKVYE
jgi:hypothetical protein